MDDRPLYYEMPPHLAEYVNAIDKRLRGDLLAAVTHLQEHGAESNDVLSALAHWGSQFAVIGTILIKVRMSERGLPPLPVENALDTFLQDVARRVVMRTEKDNG